MATGGAARQAEFRRRRDQEFRELRGERDRPSAFARAATALLIGELNPALQDGNLVARLWPNDGLTGAVFKAATAPATMTTSGWASQLVQTTIPDFVASLAPASAAAALFSDPGAMSLSFDGSGALLIPGFTSAAASASFVQEGSPIPVRQLVATSVTLSPRKLATICTFSNDIINYSLPNIEAIVTRTLIESVGAALSTAVFDATAADAARPAGLLASIGATTASAITADDQAMHDDLGTLAALVAPVAGDASPIFVASPKQYAAIKSRIPDFGFTVLMSSSLAAGVVVCIAPNAIASAIGLPRVAVADQATLHMDTAPSPFSATATPNTVAAPIRSLFQTSTIGLKVVLEVAWGLRSATGLAWTQSVVW